METPAPSGAGDFTTAKFAVAAATTTLDLAAQQVFTVNASVSRTLAFANAPAAGKAMTVVLSITGNANITWPAGISWNAATPPVLGTNFTVVILLWDGSAWKGGESFKG